MKKNIILSIFLISSFIFTSCTNNSANNLEEKNLAEINVETNIPTTPTEIPSTESIPTETPSQIVEEEKTKEPIEIDYEKIKPYEVGQIMIIMYHGIEENPPSVYQITPEAFRNDLQTLYDENYRLMSISDLTNNNVNIEPGYTPVILTFDDGINTTFSLEKFNGELIPKKDSAVDILNKFCEENPDFGKEATFFINGNNDPFKGEGDFKERIQYLLDNGYELGNHTYSHPDLGKLNSEELQKEIGYVDKMLKDAIPEINVVALTYPFGIRPKEDLRNFALNGTFENNIYSYPIAIREGMSSASSTPNRLGFDSLNIPRVRGNHGEETDLGWHLEFFRNNYEARYISDGDPNTISVPEKFEANIDLESLGDKKLNLY